MGIRDYAVGLVGIKMFVDGVVVCVGRVVRPVGLWLCCFATSAIGYAGFCGEMAAEDMRQA